MAPFRYVVADVFTDTPLDRQPARRLHRRARHPGGRAAAACAGDELLRDRLRLPAAGGGHARMRIFTPRPRCRSPATRRSARRSCSPGRCSSARSGSRPGRGLVPGAARARGRADRLRPDGAAGPDVGPFDGHGRLLAALGVDARSSRSSCTTTASARLVALASREAVAALRPDLEPSPSLAVRDNCFAGAGCAGRRECSRRPRRCRGSGDRIGRRPLALHLARHGRIAVGRGDRDRTGREIGRPSKLFARVEGWVVDDGSRSAARAVVVARGEFRSDRVTPVVRGIGDAAQNATASISGSSSAKHGPENGRRHGER